MRFYRAEPTPVTSWRLAVLMGANSRTYKFALGAALLDLASQGADAVPLADLASPYALRLAERSAHYPQGPRSSVTGGNDFLTVLEQESPATLAAGQPTERLLDAARKSMPGMVMQKFHNLRGGAVDHVFYRLRGQGRDKAVEFSPDLRRVAELHAQLGSELHARWSIVETCFDAELGRSLVGSGVAVSNDRTLLLTGNRRVAVTGAREALSGFQHGRCFYCRTVLAPDVAVHVDHVYPFSLMTTGAWAGPDLNGVWNLVVACAPCNLAKSNRQPTAAQVQALLDRNEAIAGSPHPLRRALEVGMRAPGGSDATTPQIRLAFIQQLDILARLGSS